VWAGRRREKWGKWKQNRRSGDLLAVFRKGRWRPSSGGPPIAFVFPTRLRYDPVFRLVHHRSDGVRSLPVITSRARRSLPETGFTSGTTDLLTRSHLGDADADRQFICNGPRAGTTLVCAGDGSAPPFAAAGISPRRAVHLGSGPPPSLPLTMESYGGSSGPRRGIEKTPTSFLGDGTTPDARDIRNVFVRAESAGCGERPPMAPMVGRAAIWEGFAAAGPSGLVVLLTPQRTCDPVRFGGREQRPKQRLPDSCRYRRLRSRAASLFRSTTAKFRCEALLAEGDGTSCIAGRRP